MPIGLPDRAGGVGGGGLSASTVSRLRQAKEYRGCCEAGLDQDQHQDRWVYMWAVGVNSGLRTEQAKLCALMVVDVNEHAHKRFLAIGDGAMGFRTSHEVFFNTRTSLTVALQS